MRLTGSQWSALKRGLAFSRAERTETVVSFLTGLEGVWPGEPCGRRWRNEAATATSFLAGLASDWRGRSCACWPADQRPSARPGHRARLVNHPGPERAASTMDVRSPSRLAPGLADPWLAGSGGRRRPWRKSAPISRCCAMTEVPPAIEAAPLPSPASPDRGFGDNATPAPSSQPAQSERGISGATGRPLFRDCDQCPEMVVIPAGRFAMGAPETDTDAEPDEKPQAGRGDRQSLRDSAVTRSPNGSGTRASKDGVCRDVPAASPIDFSGPSEDPSRLARRASFCSLAQ